MTEKFLTIADLCDMAYASLEASEAGAAAMREALMSLDPLIELGKHAAKSVLFAGVVVRGAEIARANALSSNAGASLLAELQRLREERVLGNGDSLRGRIHAALADYHVGYMLSEDGDGLSLVDVLTLHEDADITSGMREIELLADHLAAALSAGTAEAKEDKPNV